MKTIKIKHDIAGVTRCAYLHENETEKSSTLVIFKRGSGPVDVNTSDFAKQLTEGFADNGIDVMYYNDRGVGTGSCDEYFASRIEDFGSDMKEFITIMATYDDRKYKHIGLCGHSEGGLVSLIAASDCADVSFLILLSVPFEDMVETALYQESMKVRNWKPQVREAYVNFKRRYYSTIRDEGDTDELRSDYAKLQELKSEYGMSRKIESQYDDEMRQMRTDNNPYHQSQYQYDHQQWFGSIKCPLCAVYAIKDENVNALESCKEMLAKCCQINRHVDIYLVADVDHEFRDNQNISQLRDVVKKLSRWISITERGSKGKGGKKTSL